MGSFLEIQNVAASSRGVQDAKVPHERFQVFGIWKATIATPYGAMVTELILQPNKDFSQTAVLNGLMTYDVGTVELGEGFDYAEGFDIANASDIGPGTVLVIDPRTPGKLKGDCRPLSLAQG